MEMSGDVLISSSSRCSDYSSQISSSVYCVVDSNSNSVKLYDVFPASAYTGTSALSFTVSNIRNPRSLKPTSYFKLYTMDSLGYLIEESLESAFVEMEETPYIHYIKVSPDSLVVGAETDYYFKMKAAVPLYDGDFVQITLPSQIDAYVGSTLEYCEGIAALEDDLSCFETSSNSLNVYLDTGAEELPAKRTFRFLVSELTNPNSTAATDNFDLKIYDSGLNLIATTDPDDDASVEMEEPCPLTNAWVTHSSKMAYETTLFSFTIRLLHELPPESLIKVEWPD